MCLKIERLIQTSNSDNFVVYKTLTNDADKTETATLSKTAIVLKSAAFNAKNGFKWEKIELSVFVTTTVQSHVDLISDIYILSFLLPNSEMK